MRFNDALIGVVLLLGAVAIALYARTLPATPGQDYGAAVFPELVAFGLAGCGLMFVIGGIRRWEGAFAGQAWTKEPAAWARLVVTIGLVTAYILFSGSIGFLLISSVTMFVLFTMLGTRWWLAAGLALAVTLVIQLSFSNLLLVPLPRGLFAI